LEEFQKMTNDTNATIEDILMTKGHLADGDELFPKVFTDFSTHALLWRAYSGVAQPMPNKEELPEGWYDPKFEEEIFSTTVRLKKRQRDLYRQYGLT
jgi:hypothetical protein